MSPSAETILIEQLLETRLVMPAVKAEDVMEQFEAEPSPPAEPLPEDSLGLGFPPSISLAFLRDGRLRVVEPVKVLLSEEDGLVIAEADGLDEFGTGANMMEAITDLQYALAELFFALDEQHDRLGPSLQRTFEVLSSKIRRT